MTTNMNYLQLLIYLFLFGYNVNGQTFNKRYHFGGEASRMSCVAATDTAYYGVGVIQDISFSLTQGHYFTKFDLDGNLEFVKKFIDDDREMSIFEGSLIATHDGNFAAVGYVIADSVNAFLVKFNPFGDTVFFKEYNSFSYPEDYAIIPEDIKETSDNGFIIVDYIGSDVTESTEIALTKTDSTGEVEWQNAYLTPKNERPQTIVIDEFGNYLIGARKKAIVGQVYQSQIHILKVAPDGELLWEYTSDLDQGIRSEAIGLLPTPDGGLIVGSGKGIEEDLDILWDALIFKLNADLEIEWETDFRSSESQELNLFTDMVALPDGSGYIAAGTLRDTNFAENKYAYNGRIAKISPEGDSLWQRMHYAIQTHYISVNSLFDIVLTSDGGLLMCGETIDVLNLFDPPSWQSWLLKVDEHGCLVPGCHLIDAAPAPDIGVEISLFPNPASEILNIHLGPRISKGSLNFELINVHGQVVKTYSHSAAPATLLLPLDGLESGTYFLHCSENGVEIFTEQLVILR